MYQVTTLLLVALYYGSLSSQSIPHCLRTPALYPPLNQCPQLNSCRIPYPSHQAPTVSSLSLCLMKADRNCPHRNLVSPCPHIPLLLTKIL